MATATNDTHAPNRESNDHFIGDVFASFSYFALDSMRTLEDPSTSTSTTTKASISTKDPITTEGHTSRPSMTAYANHQGSIRVAILDPHPVFLYGLTAYLSQFPHIHVAKTCNRSRQLIALLDGGTPDVALVDYGFNTNDKETRNALIKVLSRESVRVITTTTHACQLLQAASLQAGASGVYHKKQDPLLLLRQLEDSDHAAIALPQPSEGLTDCEATTVLGLTLGLTPNQIADHLGKSPKTVNLQKLRAYHKLRIASDAELLHRLMVPDEQWASSRSQLRLAQKNSNLKCRPPMHENQSRVSN